MNELRRLTIGHPAPETEGEDLEGRPMKLSDYRGQVVLLIFWGECGGCRPQTPPLLKLLERLKGKPFAIVGGVATMIWPVEKRSLRNQAWFGRRFETAGPAPSQRPGTTTYGLRSTSLMARASSDTATSRIMVK
jgi:hypothetical protein